MRSDSPESEGSAAPEASRFAEPRRLHPASILVGVSLGQLIRGVLIPFVALAAAGGVLALATIAALAVMSLAYRILDWQRRWFSFDGHVLRVDSGVISRSHRSLDVDRIQQIEIQRGFVQRLLGLAAVRVETAGSATEPEVELAVVTESDARALREAVRAQKIRARGALATDRHGAGEAGADRGAADPSADLDAGTGRRGREVLTVPAEDVALASITGANLLVFPAFVAAALQLMGEAMSQFTERAAAELQRLGSTADPLIFSGPDWRWILPLVVVTTLVAVGVAVVFGLLRDGRFRIDRIDDDLHVSRGLLTTRESVVPISRVQLVTVHQNWLRRMMGYASVQLRSAGGSTGGEGSVTVPLVPIGKIDTLLGEILPGLTGMPELTPHPPAALRRTLFRWLRLAALLVTAAWFVPGLVDAIDPVTAARIGWASLLIVPLAVGLALVEYRHLAHALTDRVVVSRRGALSVSTALGPVGKVQAVTGLAGPFQRRLDLASLLVHVAGPGAILTIRDAGVLDGVELYARLTEHAARPGRAPTG